MELNWKTPPERTDRRTRSAWYDEIAESLRARPMEWALIKEGAKSRSAYVSLKKRRGIEMRSIGSQGGPYDFYGRYNPDA